MKPKGRGTPKGLDFTLPVPEFELTDYVGGHPSSAVERCKHDYEFNYKEKK